MSKKKRYGVIYKITNTVNGKVYIGQTINDFNGRYGFSGKSIERVYKHHKYRKEHNSNYNVHLLGAIEKYGFEVFTVDEEFAVAYSKEELDSLECKYIKEFDCINNGYNNKEGGSDGKYSEEVCKKISEARKGKCCGTEHPLYGKHHSEDSRKKMSLSHIGKMVGEKHPNFGKHLSDEVRNKILQTRIKFPVVQYTLDFKFVSEYESSREAERQTGIAHNHIIDCCKGKYYQTNGYIWVYKDDTLYFF